MPRLAPLSILRRSVEVRFLETLRNFLPSITQSSLQNQENLERRRIMSFTKLESFNRKKLPLRDSVVEQIQNSLPKNKSVYTVSVEGNIGCGKTTLLEYFKNSPNVEAVREPIDQWTNVRGHNALALLYQDPSRWNFSFNMYAMLTRVQMHTSPHVKPIKMLERSLHSTRHCFVENDHRNETINGLEYGVLDEWYNWLTKSQRATIDLIVYLQAEPHVCYDRMKQRSRKEEVGVPYSLIENLHALHEDWLIHQKMGKPPAPVLILNANCEYEAMKQVYETKRKEILCGYC